MKKFYFLLLSVTWLFFHSCSREETDENFGLNSAIDLYVFGDDNERICYWKNGDRTIFPNSGDFTSAYFGIDGKDIYATGLFSLFQSGGKREYSYWINEEKQNLNSFLNIPGNVNFYLKAFVIKNGDIYSAGYLENSSATSDLRYEYCYWKNNIKHTLFKSKYSSSDIKMLVTESDVYLAVDNGEALGFYKNLNFIPTPNTKAKYLFEHEGNIYYVGYDVSNFNAFYCKSDGSETVSLPSPNFEIFSKNGNLHLKDDQKYYKNSLDNLKLDVSKNFGLIKKLDVEGDNTFGIYVVDNESTQQKIFVNQAMFMQSNEIQNFKDIIAVSKK